MNLKDLLQRYTNLYIYIGITIIFLLILLSIFLIIQKKRSNNGNIKKRITEDALAFGAATHIGMREYQQDAFYIPDNIKQKHNSTHIAIMCDGMGGMECGEEASNLCVEKLSKSFKDNLEVNDIPNFFIEQIHKLDGEVSKLRNSDGEYANSGTTLTSIIIKENNLFWASVGDSRIYILRKNEMVQLTRDHNYELELMEEVELGILSENEVHENLQKHALISYIGIGGVEVMDISRQEFKMQENDVILLCSDGLYGTLSNDEIISIINGAGNDMQLASHQLTIEAFDKGYTNQDNITAVVVKYLKGK